MALQNPFFGQLEDHDAMPGVLEFINKTFITIREFSSFQKYPTDYAFMTSLVTTMSLWHLLAMCVLAIAFTAARYALNKYIIQPFAIWLELREVDRTKFSESIWKACVYGAMWTYTVYHIVFSGQHHFYTYTCRIWNNFNFADNYFERRQIPWEFQLLYWLQIGFYIHSVYATLRMDVWRKDSNAMLLHHFLAISMLLMSYSAKYYELGSLLLMLHDVNDVLLEVTKLNVYLKLRGGKFHKWNDRLGTIGFLLFTLCWVYTRLYLFPLKVLHGTNWCAYIYHINKTPNLWLALNAMLWPLFFMHIYWFGFMLQLLYRVLSGRMSELDDNRDYADAPSVEKASISPTNGRQMEGKKSN